MRFVAFAALVFTLPAQASETSAEFFARDRGMMNVQTKAKTKDQSANKAKEVIAREVSATLGPIWVPLALLQAKRESSFRPNAIGIKLGKRHGYQRAVGIFQILPSTARGLGFDPRFLTNLDYGVKVGIAYMRECIKVGVKTSSQMNQCFLHGYYGWGKRYAKKRNHIKRSARYSGR